MSGGVEAGEDVLDSARAGGLAIRGGALRTIAYVVAMLMSLASVPLMTRHLGTDAYGQYATVFSILFILGGVTEAGLTNLGTREYAVRDGEERERFLQNLVGLRLALTSAGILAAVALTAVTGAPRAIVAGTAIAGAGMLLALTQQTYTVALSAQLRLGWVSALELVKQSTLSLSIVGLVLVGTGLVPFFVASVVSGGAVLLCTVLVLRADAHLRPRRDRAAWAAILKEVLPYALAAAVGLVYFRLAIILMAYIADETETGLYGAAMKVAETVGVVPWLVVSSAFPILARAARDDHARLKYGLTRLFETAVLLGAFIALATILGAPFAIEVVGGDRFADATEPLQFLGVALLSGYAVATASFALLTLRRYRALLIANTIAAATAAALTFALVPKLGASGAALATVGAELVLIVAYLVGLGRTDRSLLPPVSALLRPVPAAAAMGAVGLLLDAHPVLLVAAGSVAFWAVAFATRAVPPELLNAVLRRDA